MTTSEIRKTRTELKEWIDQLNDESLLQFLQSIKISASEIKGDWFDDLSEAEKADLKIGLEDMQKDNIYSSEDFWSKIKDE